MVLLILNMKGLRQVTLIALYFCLDNEVYTNFLGVIVNGKLKNICSK